MTAATSIFTTRHVYTASVRTCQSKPLDHRAPFFSSPTPSLDQRGQDSPRAPCLPNLAFPAAGAARISRTATLWPGLLKCYFCSAEEEMRTAWKFNPSPLFCRARWCLRPSSSRQKPTRRVRAKVLIYRNACASKCRSEHKVLAS